MPAGEPTRRAGVDGRNKAWAWLPRLLWPLPGALAGATIGFHLYFRQPGLNADTVAPLAFAVLWAAGGMLAGALCTTCAGWLIDTVLRRVLPGTSWITSSATAACLAGSCLTLYAPIESRLPALLWPKKAYAPVPPSTPRESVCKQAPPTEPKTRQAWELECR